MPHDDTPRATLAAPAAVNAPATEATPPPTWSAPRAPLAPHRLAKLANALGVATPLPAHHHHPFSASTPNLASASTPSAYSDSFRRSPTPSGASTAGGYNSVGGTTSSFLLHVVPPPELLPPTRDGDTLPPPNTPGYHAKFPRGILVPLFSTLQAQLSAIAREYALPSTQGVLLYLASSPRTALGVPSINELEPEPGPRLTDDVWRVLWARVLRFERDELSNAFLLPSSRAGTPLLTPGGGGFAASPVSLTSAESLSSAPFPLRPPASPRSGGTHRSASAPRYPPPTPSTSSSSDSSGARRAHAASASFDSAPDSGVAPSEADTSALSLPLPGLDAPSLIPILARVEVVVDRARAQWLGPWMRSRRQAHSKRSKSRARELSRVRGAEDEEQERTAPMELRLPRRRAARTGPKFLHQPGEASADEGDDDDGADEGYAPLTGDEDGGDLTAVQAREDPLADVFGTDAETWASLRAEGHPRASRKVNPHVAPLALDGAALSLPVDNTEEDDEYAEPLPSDADEVAVLWNANARPRLSITTDTASVSSGRKRASSSSSSTTGTARRHIPPPLVLPPVPLLAAGATLDVATPEPPPTSASSTHLPYIVGGATPTVESEQVKVVTFNVEEKEKDEDDEDEDEDEDDDDDESATSPEKRAGTFFEDLNLGLTVDDLGDYDENDPNDRRKSQFLMAAQLDEIEKTLAQLSPRKMDDYQFAPMTGRSPSFSQGHSSSPSMASVASRLSPTTPMPRSFADAQSEPQDAQWPAVPYNAVPTRRHEASNSIRSIVSYPFPPTVAINGVTSEVPTVRRARTIASTGVSEESHFRRREQEEQESFYYPMPPVYPNASPSDSPVIPLSPDPFGRHPSSGGFPPSPPPVPPLPSSMLAFESRRTSATPPPDSGRVSATPSSRFSADSIPEEVTKSKTGGKGIKNFWRKSNKGSISVSSNAMVAPTSNSGDLGLSLAPMRESFERTSSSSGSPTPPPASPPRPPSVVRKSILKGWKTSGAGGASAPSSTAPSPEPGRMNGDAAPGSEPALKPRKRRPSIFETAGLAIRGSSPQANASTAVLEMIPPSPRVPDTYRGAPPPQGNRRSRGMMLMDQGSPSSRPSYEGSEYDALEFDAVPSRAPTAQSVL